MKIETDNKGSQTIEEEPRSTVSKQSWLKKVWTMITRNKMASFGRTKNSREIIEARHYPGYTEAKLVKPKQTKPQTVSSEAETLRVILSAMKIRVWREWRHRNLAPSTVITICSLFFFFFSSIHSHAINAQIMFFRWQKTSNPLSHTNFFNRDSIISETFKFLLSLNYIKTSHFKFYCYH